LGGGLFEYDITVYNSAGLEPIQGLLLFNAGTNFGLDDTSVIGAPQNVGGNAAANWSFFAPAPFADQLSYFSLIPAGDIPVGGTLDGFTFQSFTDPSTVTAADFQIDVVGSTSHGEIPTTLIPEPSSLTLSVILVALGVIYHARMCHKRWRCRGQPAG
jgi:hypothetical protein